MIRFYSALSFSVLVFLASGSEFCLPAFGDEPGGKANTKPAGNGDVNGDGNLDISDAIFLLDHLFLGGPPPVSLEPAPLNRASATLIANADTIVSRDWNDECGPVDNLYPYISVQSRPGIDRFSRGLVIFKLPEDSTGKSITRATLRLYAVQQAEYFYSNDFHVSQVTSEWNEEQSNWCQRLTGVDWQNPGGDFTRERESFLPIPKKEELNARIEEWFEWDVTRIVAGWAQGEIPNHGFMVWQPDVCNQNYDQAINFASLEYDAPENWPQLVVEWLE